MKNLLYPDLGGFFDKIGDLFTNVIQHPILSPGKYTGPPISLAAISIILYTNTNVNDSAAF